MKTFLLLVIIFVSFFQVAIAQPTPNGVVAIRWTNNIEPNMSHYRLFWWHGETDMEAPFESGMSVDSLGTYYRSMITYDSLQTEVVHQETFEVTSHYLQVALSAVDLEGDESRVTASNIVSLPPATPGTGTINLELIMQLWLNGGQ